MLISAQARKRKVVEAIDYPRRRLAFCAIAIQFVHRQMPLSADTPAEAPGSPTSPEARNLSKSKVATDAFISQLTFHTQQDRVIITGAALQRDLEQQLMGSMRARQ
jgi:hypothetical protein